MKTSLLVATLGLFALTSTPALAQSGHHGQHVAAANVAPASAMKMSDGTVRKVDKAAGKITIAHGPLENLGMPAMTMAFRVGDAAMLDKVKAGDKIRFVAERVDGVFSVKQLEMAQ
ncbi:copper-binding protein [Aromatoleum diolicum]|uniref:RND transporter n=1 Tax=Aromatoleum diolicum TaxID=75796 RepID=A0ABX1Q8P6_9RHOO|nr:copper-binding protein [Aromatoleum diolicum]NMG73801.1 RND transporter [Aromatoleum diolicum]